NSQRRVMGFEVLWRRWRLVWAGVAPGLEPGLFPQSSLGVADASAGADHHEAGRHEQQERTDLNARHHSEWNRLLSMSSELPSTGAPSAVRPKLRSTPSGPLRVQAYTPPPSTQSGSRRI